MSDLQKINILSKNKLDSLDTTQYPNQLFGTTDDPEDEALAFAESERQKSKNLFNINAPRFIQGGHTSVSGNTITVEAGGSTEKDAVFGLIPVKENATYYIGGNTSNKRIQFRLYDTNKNLVNQNPSGWIYNQYWEGSYKDFDTIDIITEMTIPSGVAYIAFFTAWWGSETTVSNLIISEYPDVEDYQPYNGPITHNEDAPVVFAETERQKSKNLLPLKNRLEQTSQGISYGRRSDGAIVLYGANEGVANSSYAVATNFTLKAGTYTTSVRGATGVDLILTDDVRYLSGTFTLNEDTSFTLAYIQVPASNTTFFNQVPIWLQVEEGSVVTEWQFPYGAIVREEQLNEAKVYHILGDNAIDIYNSTLTTLKEYFDLFSTDITKTYNCGIGNQHTSKFKDLVGTPPGGANFTNASIRWCVEGYSYGDFRTFEVIAVDPAANCIAIGYIYAQWSQNVVFTGWTRIGE